MFQFSLCERNGFTLLCSGLQADTEIKKMCCSWVGGDHTEEVHTAFTRCSGSEEQLFKVHKISFHPVCEF